MITPNDTSTTPTSTPTPNGNPSTGTLTARYVTARISTSISSDMDTYLNKITDSFTKFFDDLINSAIQSDEGLRTSTNRITNTLLITVTTLEGDPAWENLITSILEELGFTPYQVLMNRGTIHSLLIRALHGALGRLEQRDFKISRTNDGDKDGFPDMITISNKKIIQSSQLGSLIPNLVRRIF